MPFLPVLDFSAQQSLLSDLLSSRDAPPVTASDADAPDARAQVDAAAGVSTPTISGSGTVQNGGAAIGSEILAELEERMSAGSELLANVEAKATALVGQEEVVTLPKPVVLGGGATALALVVGAATVLSNNARKTAVRADPARPPRRRRVRTSMLQGPALPAGLAAARAGGLPEGERPRGAA